MALLRLPTVLGPITVARLMGASDWPAWSWLEQCLDYKPSTNLEVGREGVSQRKDKRSAGETTLGDPVHCLLCGAGNASRIGAGTASSPWCCLTQLSYSSVSPLCLHRIFFKVKKDLGLENGAMVWRIQTLTVSSKLAERELLHVSG